MKKLFVFLILSVCAFNLDVNASNFKEAGEYLDDASITSKVKLKLTNDKLLNPFDIHVTTKNGVVTLEGELQTKTEFIQAVMLTESLEGVKSVVTQNLQVLESHQPIKDSLITAKVLGRILKSKVFGDKEVSFWTIHVETKNGIVYLSGEVDNRLQKNNVIEIANGVAQNHAVNASALKIR